MSEQKKSKNLNPLLVQYSSSSNYEANKADRVKEFKERIQKFENVKSLAEAKELAQEIIPTVNEINRFYIDSAKCVIVNNDNMFRISFDTTEEFISYDFR